MMALARARAPGDAPGVRVRMCERRYSRSSLTDATLAHQRPTTTGSHLCLQLYYAPLQQDAWEHSILL